MKTIKERLDEFTQPNYYSRVDNIHKLDLFIGKDDKGRKSIELRDVFEPKKVLGTSAINVNQYKKEHYNIIRFSLCDDEISGLFYTFCEDLIEETRDIESKRLGYQAIINRYNQWKKMFVSSKKDMLTEPEIMGLIGEILFLSNDLKNRIGLSNALKSWSGQELTHKDFSYKNQWFEVKTIHRAASTVKISSIEQLDSEYDGELEIFVLEKMSPASNGISLNKLVIATADLFDDVEERNDFFAKVSRQGYEYNDYYDNFVFQLCDHGKFLVNQKFPKLTKANIPKAVLKVSYELQLAEINGFKIN